MTDHSVYIVSPVRDWDMYGRCLKDNPHTKDCHLIPLDNREKNRAIPVLYNEVLDVLPEHAWAVFCHEDWMPLEDLYPRLEKLDKNGIYGPVGAFLEERTKASFLHIRGSVLQCEKDGSQERLFRGAELEDRVDCFDCQCLIVHASLVKRLGLRFDLRLAFDLYAEDFCAAAHVAAGVESQAIRLKCRHYSRGTLTPRFDAGLQYLREKYAGAPKAYATTVGDHNTFGAPAKAPVYTVSWDFFTRLRYLLKR